MLFSNINFKNEKMKKMFLTATLAFATIIASAQFSILTSLNTPDEGEEWSVSSLTENIGVGYQMNDKLMVGVTKNGEESYDLLGRYTVKGAMYATCVYNYESESEAELSDKLSLGIGYSMKLWKGLYVEPNYTMLLKEDEEGSFNVSLSYKL
tara:strand:- start:291 stop:746 length:456 start_codon:yes stop_codon:yes gene_type:complete